MRGECMQLTTQASEFTAREGVVFLVFEALQEGFVFFPVFLLRYRTIWSRLGL